MKNREFKRNLVPPPRSKNFEWENVLKGSSIPDVQLDIEIGAGVGLHSILYGKDHSERKILAFERTTAKYRKFAQRLKNHDLNNIFAFHEDAINWLAHFGLPMSINRVFVLYPNPEPKNPNQRLGNMPFLGHLRTLMKPNSTLEFRTNIPEYFQETKSLLVNEWSFGISEEKVLELPEKYTTHFEKKYLGRGENCYKVIFLKS